MGFSRKECWSGLPLTTPGDLPKPGMEPASHASPALAGEFFTTSTTWEAPRMLTTKVTLSEKAMAPHSSTLAWKIPWMEQPGGLQSMGSLRVGQD